MTILFRYWLSNDTVLDEAAPPELTLEQVDSLLALVVDTMIRPPSKSHPEASLIPAFQMTDTRGRRHIVLTHQVVHVELVELEDPDPEPRREDQGDQELPGMWEFSDFRSGEADGTYVPPAVPSAITRHLKLVK
jgi:hypothetical protein